MLLIGSDNSGKWWFLKITYSARLVVWIEIIAYLAISVTSAILPFLSHFTKQLHQAIISVTQIEPVSLALKGYINDERGEKTGRK